jgi:hypothetical protein
MRVLQYLTVYFPLLLISQCFVSSWCCFKLTSFSFDKTNAIDVDMTLKVLDAFSKLVVLEPHFFNFTCRFGGEIMQ